MSRTRVWRGVTQANAIDQTKAQHAALYDALAHRRPDVARAVATAHIAGVEAWLEAALAVAGRARRVAARLSPRINYGTTFAQKRAPKTYSE